MQSPIRPARRDDRRWMGSLTAVAVSLVAVSVVAVSAMAGPAAASAANFKLTPHIANHAPTINRKWHLTIDVTRGKAKLSGAVSYQFLFSGTVVSTQKGHGFRGGVYRDTMVFPANSLGEPLTLRIVVRTKYGSEHLDWKVTPKR